MRENKIETHLVKMCKQLGVYQRKWVSPNTRSVPDRILLYEGSWYAVELKATGKTPTKLQLLEHRQIRKHGGQVIVLDSKDKVDDFLEYVTNSL